MLPEISPQLAHLSADEKRELLTRLIRTRDEQTFPLSYGQQGIWTQAQRDLHSAVFHIGFAVRIRSPLDVPALAAAVRRLAERHPSLRTAFEVRRGEVLQIIQSAEHHELQVADASQWSNIELQSRVEADFHRPFDLVRGPLTRTTLYQGHPSGDVLLFVLHHLISDFWSLALLADELPVVYRQARVNSQSDLPVESTRYADFVNWQRQLLQSPEGKRLADFWKAELRGVWPVLDWPTDYPRPSQLSHHGSLHPLLVESPLSDALRQLARRWGVTLYTVLMAAYQIFIGRMSGQDSFFVGSPFAGRTRPEFARVIGYFSNMLPVKADLSGNPSFADFVQQVGQTCLRVMAHQDYPFSKIVEVGNLPRDAGRTPLYQTTFTLEKAFGGRASGGTNFVTGESSAVRDFGDLQLEPYPFSQRTAQADLSLLLEDSPNELTGFVRYNTEIFTSETAARCVKSFLGLLRQIVESPDRRIADFVWITPDEAQQLTNWGTGPACPRTATTLSRLVARQAELTPHAVAILDEVREWTYAELMSAADRIAVELRRQGVGKGTVAAICLPRSATFVAAVLGVLKCGAAYAPLSPVEPLDRLREMLDVLQPALVVTDSTTDERLASLSQRQLCLGRELELAAPNTAESSLDVSDPDDLAYVIFTSGSTGRLQGVAVEHRAICNTIAWRNEQFPFSLDDATLLTISCTFDPSVVAIFSTLAAGARLCIPPDHAERDPARMATWLQHRPATILQMTPMQLRLACQTWAQGLASIRRVFCGGEAMPSDLPERLCSVLRSGNDDPHSPLELVNLYGPTECACDVTYWNCLPPAAGPPIPIGRPIANVALRVLDVRDQVVPIGVPGELLVGGPGLARGYWRNEAATEKRFVRYPSPDGRHKRFFRTGDLVRWRPDGALEFLGRVDQQLKLNGYRIEPEEIERVLRMHPQIRDAGVFVRRSSDSPDRLAAVLLAAEQAPRPTVSELRRFLRQKLPEHLTPVIWGWADELPVTSTGKLNRAALSSLDFTPETVDAGDPPRTPLECYLSEQFRHVLKCQSPGRDESFFDLGGSSIDAAVFINELQKKLGEYVFTVALYDAPRISDLALYIAETHPTAVERVFGRESLPVGTSPCRAADHDAAFEAFRRTIRVLPPRDQASPKTCRNRSMIFLLSAPRSGSTLTRAMLGGHPRIFAPPELQLLNFHSLRDRASAFREERNRFWLDGTVRALMELLPCDVRSARDLMEQCLRDDLTVQEFYAFLQERLGDRMLLDKTPMYALDPAALRRAEEDFHEPKYIHLIRHPAAMQASFLKAGLQTFFQPFLNEPPACSPQEFAEFVWTLSQQTILEFLESIPAQRQLLLRFENLVHDPRAEMERIAGWLGVPFDESMLTPQSDRKSRMTDPVEPLARMLGDVRFFEHQGIDRRVAENWQTSGRELWFGESTWRVAERLGYQRPTAPATTVSPRSATSPHQLLVPLQTSKGGAPIIWIHPPGGIVICYYALAKLLGSDRPVYALRARGARGAHGEGEPHTTIEAMAEQYAREILAAGPHNLVHVGGWSVGGVIAIEVARKLSEHGQRVGVIAMLDSSVPLNTADFTDDIQTPPPAAEFGLDISLVELARLDSSSQFEFVLNHARKIGLVSADAPLHLVQDTLQNLSRLFHAHVRAVHEYRLPHPLTGVTLFRPEAGLNVGTATLDNGWSDHADVAVRIVPGDHYTMLREPHVAELARKFRNELDVNERKG